MKITVKIINFLIFKLFLAFLDLNLKDISVKLYSNLLQYGFLNRPLNWPYVDQILQIFEKLKILSCTKYVEKIRHFLELVIIILSLIKKNFFYVADYFLPSRQYLTSFNPITNISQSNAYAMDFLAVNCARRAFKLIAEQKREAGYFILIKNFVWDFCSVFEPVNFL